MCHKNVEPTVPSNTKTIPVYILGDPVPDRIIEKNVQHKLYVSDSYGYIAGNVI